MSKGFDMLRDYIEHDALCMRRRKCCDFEYELQQEFAALEAENAKLRAELTDLRLGSCPSCGIKVENECLRELCMKALGWLRWAGGITCPPEVPDEFADELRELGIEVDE